MGDVVGLPPPTGERVVVPFRTRPKVRLLTTETALEMTDEVGRTLDEIDEAFQPSDVEGTCLVAAAMFAWLRRRLGHAYGGGVEDVFELLRSITEGDSPPPQPKPAA